MEAGTNSRCLYSGCKIKSLHPVINPLSPNSDQQQFSPDDFHTLS